MSATWTPLLVIVPQSLVERLTAVVHETFRGADDEDRLRIETFCAEVGWPSDALAIGAWLALVIEERLRQGPASTV